MESHLRHDIDNNNDESNRTPHHNSPQMIAGQFPQQTEVDHEDERLSATSDTPLLQDLESQTGISRSMPERWWPERGLANLCDKYRSLFQNAWDSITTLSRPKVPPGNLRISWRSARGKLMYMDLETTDTEEAEIIEARFQGSDVPNSLDSGRSGLQQASTAVAPQNSTIGNLPSDGSILMTTRSSNHHTAGQSSAQSLTGPQSPQAGQDSREKYLLLCYSIRGVHHLTQMEVSTSAGDRALFVAIRDKVLDLEAKIHPAWYLALPRKFRLLTPKHAEFVQVCTWVATHPWLD